MAQHETEQFVRLMEPVARLLLGEPNKQLSSKTELRYGNRGSIAVDLQKGTWFDHELGQGGGMLDLVERETGLIESQRLKWLEEAGFHIEREHGHTPQSNGRAGKPQFNIVKTYDYVDENGVLLWQVCRLKPKDFRQRKPTGNGRDSWSWSVRGVRNVPYRLPELLEATAQGHTVFVVEGEKDADNLWAIGLPATTNAGGAGKWRDDLNDFFHDADVVVIEDHDPQKRHPKTNELMFHQDGRPMLPGQDHARAVAVALNEVAERVRLLQLVKSWPQMPLKGDVSDWLEAGHTREQLDALVEELPRWTPELDREIGDAPVRPTRATPYVLPDPRNIPARSWLYGGHYVRTVVTATVAPGGFGKTTLALFEAITMAAEGHRVWYISGEDQREEIDRRIAAHCQHHQIMQSLIDGQLFVDDKASYPLTIGKASRTMGVQFDEDWLARFEAAITADKIDVVILDPFISFHTVPEADNGAIDQVVKRLASIAGRCDCCIEINHHVRKAAYGQTELTVDDTRGGSAIVNAVRSSRVINRMSEREADLARIAYDKRSSYLRLDKGKRNMAPPEAASWFQLLSVHLANGDNVQAMEPWPFPAAFAGMTAADVTWVQNLLRERPRRASSQSDDWLGHYLGQRFNRETGDKAGAIWANKIIGQWLRNNVFKKLGLRDPESRKPNVPFYVPIDFKITHESTAELPLKPAPNTPSDEDDDDDTTSD